MENYVTLFDSLFLPQGLALLTSMERHVQNYTLWILCADHEAYEVLTKLQLKKIRLLQLSKLETAELLRVKPTRTKVEYYWTLTPFTPQFVFDADPEVEAVTYIDADIWFRGSPAAINDEFNASNKSVLITEHAYTPEYDESYLLGKFCVQYITVKKNGCQLLLRDWQRQCLEWCYAFPSNNRFGDQKYLDSWPEKYNSTVHILQDKSLIMAPWNSGRFPYSDSLIWHFHGLRINTKKSGGVAALLGSYPLPNVVYKYIYIPYIADIKAALNTLSGVRCFPRNQFSYSIVNVAKILFGQIFHRLFGYRFFNIIMEKKYIDKKC
jgi:hypothetical protein